MENGGVGWRSRVAGTADSAGSADVMDLLGAACEGRRWAVDALARRYRPRLAEFARRRGASDPDGIADLALMSVLSKLNRLRFEAPEQLWAYLCMTARSRIIDEHRAAKPVELFDDHGPYENGDRWSDSFDQQVVDGHYVAELLSPLTDDQRQVLELRFLEDLSVEETASRIGRTQGAVKGLQRRAINAILAVVAILLVVLVIRELGGDTVEMIDQSPADSNGTDTRNDDSLNGGDPLDGGTTNSEQGSADEPDTLTIDGSDDAGNPDGDVEASLEPSGSGERFVVTAGTDRSLPLDASGPAVPVNQHGARMYCPVAHFSYDDPITHANAPGASPARMYWGNTGVTASADGPSLAASGNGTCEGGTTDRSAYWMPALFDDQDQAVLPERVDLEYLAFGGEQFDRATLRRIPIGLELVAGPSATDHTALATSAGAQGGRLEIAIEFPNCVQVGTDGAPVLSSGPAASHLTYSTGDEDGSSNCPTSHPYRIPTLTYSIFYAVAPASDWYLAGAAAGSEQEPAAWAISAWDANGMSALVSCVRDTLLPCEFTNGERSGEAVGRGHLPERLDGPDGTQVYRDSVTLLDTVDRTPFGAELSPTPS